MIEWLRYAPPVFWRWVMFFGLGVSAFTAVMMGLANARDLTGKYANSAYKEWFSTQHNSDGQWCCDQTDGHEYDGNYSFNSDGSVTVDLAGKPHVIPKQMILSGANPTGRAIWWFIDTTAYGHVDFCFAPGTLS